MAGRRGAAESYDPVVGYDARSNLVYNSSTDSLTYASCGAECRVTCAYVRINGRSGMPC